MIGFGTERPRLENIVAVQGNDSKDNMEKGFTQEYILPDSSSNEIKFYVNMIFRW